MEKPHAKIRLLKSSVWPVVSYGCESWTLESTDGDRIKSFETKAFRQILRVTWTDKRTNDWVLRKAGINLFCYSQSRKESFLIMVVRAAERTKLHGERNNARYYFWSNKRKTKNTLAG